MTVQALSWDALALTFLPTLAVLAVLFRWRVDAWDAVYATARMLVQLLAIGYVLGAIFTTDSPWLIGAVLLLMLSLAAWIATRSRGVEGVAADRSRFSVARWDDFSLAWLAIAVGAVPTLVLVTQVVLEVQPWFSPRFVVPLAGMIFASSMTAVSLASERLVAELARHGAGERDQARRIALRAALIPITNSFFAVGLVSLPGMMTGQILAGTSPLIAAQYQIVVMTMIFGATGLSAAVFLAAKTRKGVGI